MTQCPRCAGLGRVPTPELGELIRIPVMWRCVVCMGKGKVSWWWRIRAAMYKWRNRRRYGQHI